MSTITVDIEKPLGGLSELTLWVVIYSLTFVVTGLIILLIAFPQALRVEGLDVSGLPRLHASINGVTAVLLGLAYVAIRNRRIKTHLRLMCLCFALSCVFLASYVIYHSQAPPAHFGGEGWIRPVYFSILISHVSLAVVVLPLALFTLSRALRGELERHRRIARRTLPLWMYVAVTGVLVYLMMAPYYAEEAAAGESPPEGPTLVVLISVDQLRADLLDRYESLFTGGFRRLLDRGHRFVNGTHDHAKTSTAPGHTTLATGVHPTRHGIVGNEWSELRAGQWRNVYSVGDPGAGILGVPRMPGRSPVNMYREGLPDWISRTSPDARVVSISRKDRAAIGLAGKAVGEVYWMADPLGRFITSTFYHSEYPDWVRRFNEEVMPRIYADTVWESRVPEEAAHLTRPDTSAYERRGVPSFFPYRASEAVDVTDPAALNRWRYRTPLPDAAVLGLAEAAIAELELGRRSVVDYLGLSFSQTDHVGHVYGPLSREQLDNLLRLDALLGDLFQLLDEVVGPEGWVAGLSADHGILEIPEHLADRGVDARRLGVEERTAFQRAVLGAVEGDAQGDALAWQLKAALEALPFIEGAYTFAEVLDAQARPDSFAVLFARSHSRVRAAEFPARYGVYFRFRPNFLSWSADDATTHGSPYYYDRSVPIIFLGAGVEAGVSQEAAATVDVAPTLARLAGIETPGDLDGRVLLQPPSR